MSDEGSGRSSKRAQFLGSIESDGERERLKGYLIPLETRERVAINKIQKEIDVLREYMFEKKVLCKLQRTYIATKVRSITGYLDEISAVESEIDRLYKTHLKG